MQNAKPATPAPYKRKGSSTCSKIPPMITPAKINFAKSVKTSLFQRFRSLS